MSGEVTWLATVRGGDVRAFYAELGVELGFGTGENANHAHCFANPEAHKRDDRIGSCSVNLINGMWRCHGCGATGNAFTAAVAMGLRDWQARELAQKYALFESKGKRGFSPRPSVAVRRAVTPIRIPPLPKEKQLAQWREALLAYPKVLDRLEELKGWSVQGIVRCGLGWDGERVVFPVRNAKLDLVGLVRYLPGGGKFKMLGAPGRERGMFPPPEVMTRRRTLFVVEGEPAAVSVISCGACAVGIPGKNAWRPEWAKRLMDRRLVILPDCDPEGRDLMYRVHMALPMSQVVDVDPSLHDGLDIGDWITAAVAEGGREQMTRLFRNLEKV